MRQCGCLDTVITVISRIVSKLSSGVRGRAKLKSPLCANSGSWSARASLKVDGSFCRDTYTLVDGGSGAINIESQPEHGVRLIELDVFRQNGAFLTSMRTPKCRSSEKYGLVSGAEVVFMSFLIF